MQHRPDEREDAGRALPFDGRRVGMQHSAQRLELALPIHAAVFDDEFESTAKDPTPCVDLGEACFHRRANPRADQRAGPGQRQDRADPQCLLADARVTVCV